MTVRSRGLPRPRPANPLALLISAPRLTRFDVRRARACRPATAPASRSAARAWLSIADARPASPSTPGPRPLPASCRRSAGSCERKQRHQRRPEHPQSPNPRSRRRYTSSGYLHTTPPSLHPRTPYARRGRRSPLVTFRKLLAECDCTTRPRRCSSPQGRDAIRVGCSASGAECRAARVRWGGTSRSITITSTRSSTLATTAAGAPARAGRTDPGDWLHREYQCRHLPSWSVFAGASRCGNRDGQLRTRSVSLRAMSLVAHVRMMTRSRPTRRAIATGPSSSTACSGSSSPLHRATRGGGGRWIESDIVGY